MRTLREVHAEAGPSLIGYVSVRRAMSATARHPNGHKIEQRTA